MDKSAILRALKAKVEPIVEECLADTIAKVNETYDEVIEDDSGKYFPDFPGQDIVDTSRFLNSKMVDASRFHASWSWDPVDPDTGFHYARGLLVGFWAYGKKWIDGRDWIKATMNEVRPVSDLAEGLASKGLDAKVIFEEY